MSEAEYALEQWEDVEEESTYGAFEAPEPEVEEASHSATEESVETSFTAFDPEVFGPVVIIQLNRIYDVLMNILAESSPRGPHIAKMLAQLHESGQFLSPPPAYAYSMDTEVTEQ